jgi:hypothetical protein
MLKDSPDRFRFGKDSRDFSNHIDRSFLQEHDYSCGGFLDVSVLILSSSIKSVIPDQEMIELSQVDRFLLMPHAEVCFLLFTIWFPDVVTIF